MTLPTEIEARYRSRLGQLVEHYRTVDDWIASRPDVPIEVYRAWRRIAFTAECHEEEANAVLPT